MVQVAEIQKQAAEVEKKKIDDDDFEQRKKAMLRTSSPSDKSSPIDKSSPRSAKGKYSSLLHLFTSYNIILYPWIA